MDPGPLPKALDMKQQGKKQAPPGDAAILRSIMDAMPLLTEEQAAGLARAFAENRQRPHPLGPLSSVAHREGEGKEEGEYRVEFQFGGPPPRRKTTPPRDHPTVVFVGDRTGKCRFMFWM